MGGGEKGSHACAPEALALCSQCAWQSERACQGHVTVSALRKRVVIEGGRYQGACATVARRREVSRALRLRGRALRRLRLRTGATRTWSRGGFPASSARREHVGGGGPGRRVGGLRGAALPGRVRQRHRQPPEGAGRVPAVRAAERRAAVRLLPGRGHVPLQLLPQRLHRRRGQLRAGRVPEDPDQPAEQGRVPGHLAGAGLRRLPLRQHHPAPRRHQLRGLSRGLAEEGRSPAVLPSLVLCGCQAPGPRPAPHWGAVGAAHG